ncbi:single-stranded DNA-binding protein [Candidatus Babeliales bacterium]|nr:single-stranded DNA-binding protein [Candidatus Babeliales bacterium]
MAGYNRIVMVGNLTRDPEYKQLASGQAVCRLGLATNRQFKNRQTGMMSQEVCYVDIDVWGPQAESCRQYLSKGRPVLVEGRLKFDTWQDPQGGTRSKHSIAADRVVFLAAQSANAEGLELGSEAGEDAFGAGAIAAPSYTTQNTAEFSKIEQAVAKKTAAKKVVTPKKEGVAMGAEFKDEPPFEDELPF